MSDMHVCQHIKGKNLNGKAVPVQTTKAKKRKRRRRGDDEEGEELQLHSFNVAPNGWI